MRLDRSNRDRVIPRRLWRQIDRVPAPRHMAPSNARRAATVVVDLLLHRHHVPAARRAGRRSWPGS